jgi:hypothetical protein
LRRTPFLGILSTCRRVPDRPSICNGTDARKKRLPRREATSRRQQE